MSRSTLSERWLSAVWVSNNQGHKGHIDLPRSGDREQGLASVMSVEVVCSGISAMHLEGVLECSRGLHTFQGSEDVPRRVGLGESTVYRIQTNQRAA